MTKIEFDPDKLELSKKQLLSYCDECLSQWNKNRLANLHLITGMNGFKITITIIPSGTLDAIWKKLLEFVRRMEYDNAKSDDGVVGNFAKFMDGSKKK